MPVSLSAARHQSTEHAQFAALRSISGVNSETPVTLNDYLRAIHGSSSRLHYRRGETIFSEGEPADRVCKLICGTIRLCRYSPDGRRHIVDFVHAGELIGFLECADQPWTAEAVTDVTLVSYPRAGVDRLAASNPAIRTRILCHLSANLLEAQQQLFVLGCQCAKERVASFLVRLADRVDLLAGEALDLPMGRQDIADHLGLTVETVCRVLSALKSESLIAIPNSHELILKDMDALRAMAVEF
jgi:CRP-like cAMP-binding protein